MHTVVVSIAPLSPSEPPSSLSTQTIKPCMQFFMHFFACLALSLLSMIAHHTPSPPLVNFIAYVIQHAHLHSSISFISNILKDHRLYPTYILQSPPSSWVPHTFHLAPTRHTPCSHHCGRPYLPRSHDCQCPAIHSLVVTLGPGHQDLRAVHPTGREEEVSAASRGLS